MTSLQRDQILDNAEAEHYIAATEASEVIQADLLFRPRTKEYHQPAVVVVEISARIDDYDVTRAADRAAIFTSATHETTIPVVVGEYVDEDTVKLAEERFVQVIASRYGGAS